MRTSDFDTEHGEYWEYTIQTDEKEMGEYNRYFITESNTIGQYTGLKDRNGVEIYEGDIIARMTNDGKESHKSIVKYGKFNCSCCNGVYGWYFDGGDIRDCEYDLCEVIGNIYDNPELLESED